MQKPVSYLKNKKSCIILEKGLCTIFCSSITRFSLMPVLLVDIFVVAIQDNTLGFDGFVEGSFVALAVIISFCMVNDTKQRGILQGFQIAPVR